MPYRFDEAKALWSAGVDERPSQRSALAGPADKVLDVVRGPEVVFPGVVARLPEEFERTHRQHLGTKRLRQPTELPMSRESWSRHWLIWKA